MRIRTKAAGLVLTLVSLVVGMVAANLILVERAGVERDFGARTDSLLEGVSRLARESLLAKDELMLLSYLMFLMKDHPELEIAVVSRKGHTSVIGEVKTELFYRTITLTDPTAAQFKSSSKALDTAASESAAAAETAAASEAAAGAQGQDLPQDPSLPKLSVTKTAGREALPPSTFMIQLGFSKTILDRQARAAVKALMARISIIAGLGLLLASAGAWWLGKLITRPVTELAAASESLSRGDLDARVNPSSDDELGGLGRSFNAMASRLREQIRFKEDLLSTLSHELRTPLGGLKGYVELLESAPSEPPAERAKSLRVMADTISQMEKS
ncbi:MAG: HAMP domain-containing protein, partial [Elusimicrobiota bacterium]